ncbi:MAG: hypothetical protein ACK55Z_36010 [bacterium]
MISKESTRRHTEAQPTMATIVLATICSNSYQLYNKTACMYLSTSGTLALKMGSLSRLHNSKLNKSISNKMTYWFLRQ